MNQSQRNRERIRFGVFELDRRAGELTRRGLKVKLEDKPARLLAALLRRPREVVTREELRKELWPDDIHLDFDHSLNSAVRRLRSALGDSSSNPRYIETLSKRGYRFIYPVDNGGLADPATSVERGHLAGFPPTKRTYTGPALAVAAVVLVAVVGWQLIEANREDPHPAGRAVPLTSYDGAEIHPDLSPDGNQVAFAWKGDGRDNFDIFVKVVGAGMPLRLTTDPAHELSPVWSPDGSTIAFTRGDAIYTVPPLGGAERKVAEVPGLAGRYSRRIAWTPSGEQLLVCAADQAGSYPIYSVSVRTGDKEQITPAPDGMASDRLFALSPDGESLAFVRRFAGGPQHIYVMSIGGGEPRELLSHRGFVSGLAWTGDGREIIYDAGVLGARSSLMRISASGGSPRPLMGFAVSGGELGGGPAVSGRARRLVYVSGQPSYSMWRYPLPGGTAAVEPARELTGSTEEEIQPAISPDGTRIAYVGAQTGSREIWTCGVDGTNCVQATDTGEAITCNPSWSPDGKRIAFGSSLDGEYNIYAVDAEGGVPTRLTTHVAEDLRAGWSSNGKWVYFASRHSGSVEVWKVPSAGGDAVQITRGGGRHLQVSPDGRFLYFSRPGSGLWRMPAGGGAEEPVLPLLEGADPGAWVVVEDGVYFIASEAKPAPGISKNWFLKFHSSDTGEVSVAASLREEPRWMNSIDVSPDRRWFFCAHSDWNADLMLVENFP